MPTFLPSSGRRQEAGTGYDVSDHSQINRDLRHGGTESFVGQTERIRAWGSISEGPAVSFPLGTYWENRHGPIAGQAHGKTFSPGAETASGVGLFPVPELLQDWPIGVNFREYV